MSDMSYNCQTVHDLWNEVANSVQDAIQCKSDCDDKDIKAYKNLDKWFYLMEHLHSED